MKKRQNKKCSQEAKQAELIKARKTNKEAERQLIRKDLEKSSRLLDNYYDPKIHQKFWNPNGLIKSTKCYTNNKDTGLGFNYDNQSNQNKERSKEESKRIHKQRHFIEFDYMENNDIIITIEHCSNCEEHKSHTNHINNIYLHFSKILQRVILLRFPFIKIYLKPIEACNYDAKSNRDSEDREIKLGALEIQYAAKISDNVNIVPLHSKLNSGQWPSIYNILNKISALVPLIHLKCSVYDKEEGLIEDNQDLNANNDRISNLLPTSIENIKVNLYLVRNELIERFSIEAMDELDIIYDPRRRQYAYYEQFKQKNQCEHSKTISSSNSKSSHIIKNTSSRLLSSTNRSKTNGAHNYSSYSLNRPNSSSSFNTQHSTFNKLSSLETLSDPDAISKLKGKLLSSGYTDNTGGITFQNLPYDSYLVEIEASKHFLMNGALIFFDKVSGNSAKGEEKIMTVDKYFGLLRQIDSYVEVYIYSNESQTDLDFDLINEAKVYLIRSYECGNSLFPPGKDRLEVKENDRIKGRYEIITSPGLIVLEIIKEGYEPIKREITLRSGENKINIELSNN